MARTSTALSAWLLAVLAAAALPAAQSADRNALREIVQQRCIPGWLRAHDPSPCERVLLSDRSAPQAGYALLHDRKGGAHFLLIAATANVSGIESPVLLQPGSPNYFAAAWEARGLVDRVVGHAVPRDRIGLAINSRAARGQDQLHIHIECVGDALYRALQQRRAQLTSRWTALPIGVWTYQARRLSGATLANLNVFELLADSMGDARAHMGSYTLVAAGMQFADGPGFALITGRDLPGGELLLDGGCKLAR